MWTFPVLLDCRPRFLPRARGGSLLLSPLGDATVLSHLRSHLSAITEAPPVIVTRFEIDPSYEAAIRKACPEVEVVETLPSFIDRLHTYEPSDRLLLADPACFPLKATDPAIRRLGEGGDDLRRVSHLVAFGQGGDGPREYVETDSSGRIRGIQRYYDAVTWPFATGVACSLVPVACLRVAYELPLANLQRLRNVLVSEGVPSRDVPLERGAVSLDTERGLLALNERVVHSLVEWASTRPERHSSAYAARGARVHPRAIIVGPVIMQAGAEVEEGATIIGPSVLGEGSKVEAGATVAQCVVGPGQIVAAGTTLRHRVLLGVGESTTPEPSVLRPELTDVADPNGWETAPVGLSPGTPRRTPYTVVKRIIDVAVAATGLVLLSPLGLLIAALIKLESKGPVHFGHVREGVGGRPFRCWKFRTMVYGADQQQRKLAGLNMTDGRQFKVKQDPRRTRIGRFVTAANLDEILQLWNVLVGEMSLVGPRPSPFRENQVCVPWRMGRLSVRPGVTGLWQICRHDRHKGDFHQWIYYDLLYVRNRSFWLDLKILALTPFSFARSGHVPVSWVLRPEQYGERRSVRREHYGDRRSEDRELDEPSDAVTSRISSSESLSGDLG